MSTTKLAPSPSDVTAVLRELLASLRRFQPKDSWSGWENGDGEEVGERLEIAIRRARRLLRAVGEAG